VSTALCARINRRGEIRDFRVYAVRSFALTPDAVLCSEDKTALCGKSREPSSPHRKSAANLSNTPANRRPLSSSNVQLPQPVSMNILYTCTHKQCRQEINDGTGSRRRIARAFCHYNGNEQTFHNNIARY